MAAGGTAIVQGTGYLTGSGELTLSRGLTGLLGIVSGVSLLLGFLTPLANLLVGAGAIAATLGWLPEARWNLFDATFPAALVVIIAAAVIFLGPGAWSIDALQFGRREIVIPYPPHSKSES